MGKIMIDGDEYTKSRIGAYPDAKDQVYNNSNSINISSNRTQGALDELDIIIGDLSDIDGLSNATIVNAISDLVKIFGSSRSVFTGSTKSILFSSFAVMETWLKKSANKCMYSVGDILYILDKNSSDYWISEVRTTPNPTTSYYYDINVLESDPIDLSKISTAVGNTDISSIANGTITGAISTFKSEHNALELLLINQRESLAEAIISKGKNIQPDLGTDYSYDNIANKIKEIGSSPILQEKTGIKLSIIEPSIVVTQDDNYDGLKKVSASIDMESKDVTVYHDTVTITPNSGKVLKSVNILGPSNYGGTTQSASNINDLTDTIELNIPNNGYYNTASKLSINRNGFGANITIDGAKYTNPLELDTVEYGSLGIDLSDYLPEGVNLTAETKIYIKK